MQGLSWLSGTVPLDLQTGVLVPLFKKGDRRVCTNYQGITLLSLPGKVYSIDETSYPRETMWFSFRSCNTEPALY